MFSVGLRKALHQPQCAWRTVSLASMSQTPRSEAILLLRRNMSELSSSASTKSLGSAPLVSSFARPVYVSLSSLLPPKEGSSLPDEVVELDPFIFSHPIRRDILHLCVVHYLDSLRQGSASTKTRGEVRGSGRKIRPQKGSGKARLGDGQSPMLRGGGVAFGPKPRDFSTKLPRKVIQMGMRVALSAKVREHGLGIVQSLEWPEPKTRGLSERLEELGWQKTLFVTGQEKVPDALEKAASNLYKINTITAEELNVYSLVKWPRVVLDVAAVEWFESALRKPATIASATHCDS